VIVEAELLRVEPATPLLASVLVTSPRALGDNLGHVMSHAFSLRYVIAHLL
jgi:hypothetical protein